MVRKTFSICDSEVLKWLGSMEKGLQSKYITRLVREDMGKNRGVLSRDDVIRLIKEYGGERFITEDKAFIRDSKVVNSIKGLINL